MASPPSPLSGGEGGLVSSLSSSSWALASGLKLETSPPSPPERGLGGEAHARPKARLAVLLSGRGSNLKALHQSTQTGALKNLAHIAIVFSNDPAAPGLAWAAAQGLPTAALPSAGRRRADYDAEVAALLATHAPDFVLLAGYMRILSPAFIQPFAGRILNIHPADTRRHQGLHAYEWAWENRLPETYITVHLVDEGLDTGPILAQQAVDLTGADSLAEVERRGLAVEHELYAETVASLVKNWQLRVER